MQEIALFLSSIAGACTAAAVKKFPKNKIEAKTIGANSQIKNQINSLRLEKEILTKTITRLYQNDAGLNKIQRDKLLLRYQHQLGIILAKIEKLDMASKHPDLGPVGEGLITLMDQKLSQLDKRLYELSSKITIANSQSHEVKTQVVKEKEETKKEKPVVKPQEKPVEEKIEEKPQEKIIIPKIQTITQLPRSVELTTLTELSNRHRDYPLIEQKLQPKNEIADIKQQEKPSEKVEDTQNALKPEATPETQKQEIQTNVPITQENVTQIKQEKPQATKVSDEDKIDEDEDDLDKIKGEIMKTLSRLEQAEVE
ncbi:MAG TPA: hypothetical protein VFG25_05360 [Nitrosopumilaceae archaeon]|nr:hypothetical protein [Nitrosopumilaceae archaeon]